MSSDTNDQVLPIGKVVEELSAEYPDVTHSSLRFLENQGLSHPTRTPGGHRLFSQADVARIRQIKEWQRQHLSLGEIRERLTAAEQLGPPEQAARSFLDLAASGKLAAAQDMVLRLADLGLPMEKIFQQVMTPALYELGRRWQSGELLVGQEKEISALSRDLIAHLSLSASSEPSHEASIVAACVTGEHHELGLRMIVGVLQSHGYLVHYLGPDVSPPFLLEAVRLRRPDLVLLSATLASHLDSVRETARVLVAELPAESMPTLVIGGQIVAVHHDALIGLGLHASENGDIETTIQRVLALIEPEAD